MKKAVFVFIAWFACLVPFFSGCVSLVRPLQSNLATPGIRAASNARLKSLPPPKDKIVAAVYKFRDQTGQYKTSSTSSSFSTAVTQGATSILLRAIEESGWFIPIEREGLSNLLNERKIIRSSRAEYMGNKSGGTTADAEPLLPPLLFAGVILEGGIISYETNLVTGGPGFKYFGVGASGQYREDRVTVYLRATSTQNGRILKTVYTSKTILSQLVDFNLYRFVDFQKLLEAEVGYSYNEPADLCVTEAIEKAVGDLVIEGIFDKLWEPKAPDVMSPIMIEYKREKAVADRTDYFGEPLIQRPSFGAGVSIGGQLYQGDYTRALVKPASMLSLQLTLSQEFSLAGNAGWGKLGVEKYFDASLFSGDVVFTYRFLPGYRLTPFVFAGGGMISISTRPKSDPEWMWRDKLYPTVTAGGGFEYMINGNIGLSAAADNHYAMSDKLDALEHGKWNDFYWGARIGMMYYFGN